MNRHNNVIIVIIATCDRPHLLRHRSLPSINLQTFQPDTVILVDDSADIHQEINKKIFFNTIPSTLTPTYLKNARNKGNAGAWNTGLKWIEKRDRNAWVAILDDDDWWEPEHLAYCVSAIGEDVDGVIPGIQTLLDGEALPVSSREYFTVSDFLRGNPGWEGSNTFLKFLVFKRVGFFDEKLTCTHDRDLAIRLLENSLFRYKILSGMTVHHYIEKDRPSLTNSSQKRIGMLQFWKKHSWRMSKDDKSAFLERAENLFQLNRDLFEDENNSKS